jgi:hypothetical protein
MDPACPTPVHYLSRDNLPELPGRLGVCLGLSLTTLLAIRWPWELQVRDKKFQSKAIFTCTVRCALEA